jgi:hypothetical protein
MLGGLQDLSKLLQFKLHSVSNPSVHGAGTRGDQVERMVDDMFTTAIDLKLDAGPKLAKLGIKLKLPQPYNGSANIDQFRSTYRFDESAITLSNTQGTRPRILSNKFGRST